MTWFSNKTNSLKKIWLDLRLSQKFGLLSQVNFLKIPQSRWQETDFYFFHIFINECCFWINELLLSTIAFRPQELLSIYCWKYYRQLYNNSTLLQQTFKCYKNFCELLPMLLPVKMLSLKTSSNTLQYVLIFFLWAYLI